jgi:hypothetical protein
MIKFAQNNNIKLNFSTISELMSDTDNSQYLISGPEITELQNIRNARKNIKEIYNSFLTIFKIFSTISQSHQFAVPYYSIEKQKPEITYDIDPISIRNIDPNVDTIMEIVSYLKLDYWDLYNILIKQDTDKSTQNYPLNEIEHKIPFGSLIYKIPLVHNAYFLGETGDAVLDGDFIKFNNHRIDIRSTVGEKFTRQYSEEINNVINKIAKFTNDLMAQCRSRFTILERRHVISKSVIHSLLNRYKTITETRISITGLKKYETLIAELMYVLSYGPDSKFNKIQDNNINNFINEFINTEQTLRLHLIGNNSKAFKYLFDKYFDDNPQLFISIYQKYLKLLLKQDFATLSAQTGINFNENNFSQLCSTFDINNHNDIRQILDITHIRSISQCLQRMASVDIELPAKQYITIYLNYILANIRSNENLERLFSTELRSFYEITQNEDYKGSLNREDCKKMGISYNPDHVLFNRALTSRMYYENKLFIVDKLESSMNKIKRRTVELTETDRLRMKELGITEALPPEMLYSIKQQQFPGGGFMKKEQPEAVEFIIDFSPSLKILESELPAELFKTMHAHSGLSKGVEDLPAFGWVGGFYDPISESMYIHEVQSDVYQLATYMVDPKVADEEKKKRIEEINKQIEITQQQIAAKENPKKKKDPTIILTQKINNSNKKIEELKTKLQSLTPEQQSERTQIENSIKQEELFVSNINKQIENIKLKEKENTVNEKATNVLNTEESIPENKADAELNNLHKKILNLNKEKEDLEEIKKDDRYFKRGRFAQFSQYKNKLENVFREWIKIFFNGAFREAKHLQVKKMYIITPEALLKIWATFARPATRILFEKVYRENAAFYTSGVCSKCGKRLKPKWVGTNEIGDIPYDSYGDLAYTSIEYWGCKDHPEERGTTPPVKQFNNASFFEINMNSDSIRIASTNYGKK